MHVYRDALHGYEIELLPGWLTLVHHNLILLRKAHMWVAVGAIQAPQGLAAAASQLLTQLQNVSGPSARFYQRSTPQGLTMVADGVSYPFFLNPIEVMSQEPLPQQYRLIGELFGGQTTLMLTLFYLPMGTPLSWLQEARQSVARLRFLPADQRVPYQAVLLPDPYLGVPYGMLHVPITAQIQGFPLRQGHKYCYRWEVKERHFGLRLDFVDVQTQVVMGQSMTLITYNGNSQPWPNGWGPPLQQPTQLGALLAQLWQLETGQSWQLGQPEIHPLPPLNAGPFGQGMAWQGTLQASAGRWQRYVEMQCYGAGGVFDWLGNAYGQLNSQLKVLDVPQGDLAAVLPVVRGILGSLQPSPEWAFRAHQEFVSTNRRINQQLAAYLSQRRQARTYTSSPSSSDTYATEPFSSEIARAWSNALSDQTYLRDPETGDVLRVYKKVWDEGRFWKDPTWGDLYGTVERGSDLERDLHQAGWQPMQESIWGTDWQ
ncbi:MAG: hypothetical protein RMI89_04680 [Gloeomargarita sp. SKYBB_i_bin120]|nr:hypothetical protein [Gloeomargarita sp. SKYG98]MCS7292256.1 hypothetical protein [Gloeomargarita sp. SKYB120]MDW8177817.1 hypothetical protein [Gloeomargarita sp. SKYBB_i_bin120]